MWKFLGCIRGNRGTKQGMELPHYSGFRRIWGFEFKTCSVVPEACFDFRLYGVRLLFFTYRPNCLRDGILRFVIAAWVSFRHPLCHSFEASLCKHPYSHAIYGLLPRDYCPQTLSASPCLWWTPAPTFHVRPGS